MISFKIKFCDGIGFACRIIQTDWTLTTTKYEIEIQ